MIDPSMYPNLAFLGPSVGKNLSLAKVLDLKLNVRTDNFGKGYIPWFGRGDKGSGKLRERSQPTVERSFSWECGNGHDGSIDNRIGPSGSVEACCGSPAIAVSDHNDMLDAKHIN